MAVDRRTFLKKALRAAALSPLLWAARRTLPVRCTEALRARFYPGPAAPLDPAKLRKPGKWAG